MIFHIQCSLDVSARRPRNSHVYGDHILIIKNISYDVFFISVDGSTKTKEVIQEACEPSIEDSNRLSEDEPTFWLLVNIVPDEPPATDHSELLSQLFVHFLVFEEIITADTIVSLDDRSRAS